MVQAPESRSIRFNPEQGCPANLAKTSSVAIEPFSLFQTRTGGPGQLADLVNKVLIALADVSNPNGRARPISPNPKILELHGYLSFQSPTGGPGLFAVYHALPLAVWNS